MEQLVVIGSLLGGLSAVIAFAVRFILGVAFVLVLFTIADES
jgi:hypothetical protein